MRSTIGGGCRSGSVSAKSWLRIRIIWIRIRRENCLIFNLTSSKRWRKSSIQYENPLCGGRFKSLKSWIWNICCVCGWDYYNTLYSKFLNLEPHEIVTLNKYTKKSFLFCEAVEFKFFFCNFSYLLSMRLSLLISNTKSYCLLFVTLSLLMFQFMPSDTDYMKYFWWWRFWILPCTYILLCICIRNSVLYTSLLLCIFVDNILYTEDQNYHIS